MACRAHLVPTLPRVISQAGIEFTILDDTHFSYSGLEDKAIHGYYITESEGYPLNLFPISKELRYSIPFDLPEVTLEKLVTMQKERQCEGLTYADDGEKFGSWPDTWDWVYGERYLERLFQSLQDNRDKIETLHFGEYLDQHRPNGRVYLPPASYEEMMEWALPVHTSQELHHLKQEMTEKEIDPNISRRFIRGGLWNNFLVKYPRVTECIKGCYWPAGKLISWQSPTLINRKLCVTFIALNATVHTGTACLVDFT